VSDRRVERRALVVGVVALVAAAIGTLFGPPVAKLYLELAADFPLGGGSGSPDFFSQQTISVGAGLQLNL